MGLKSPHIHMTEVRLGTVCRGAAFYIYFSLAGVALTIHSVPHQGDIIGTQGAIISPLEDRGAGLPAKSPAYMTPDRASLPELIATSTDAAALCMNRKTAHERFWAAVDLLTTMIYGDELTTNGASPRRSAHPKMTDETRDRASSPEIIATSPYAPADGMARKTTHERYLGRRRSSQSDELTTNGGQARTPSDRIVDGVP